MTYAMLLSVLIINIGLETVQKFLLVKCHLV